MIIVPTGLAEIRKTFGDPESYIREDGTVHPNWEHHTQGILELPAPLPLGWDHSVTVRRIRIHYRLLSSLGKILDTISRNGDWNKIATFDGTYNWRAKRRGHKLSTHAWGIAIDLNAATNQLGTDGDMPLEIIKPFEDEGWKWGGDFRTKDPMHFQACFGYTILLSIAGGVVYGILSAIGSLTGAVA